MICGIDNRIQGSNNTQTTEVKGDANSSSLSLAQQLEALLKQYRLAMANNNTADELKCMQEIDAFINQNKEAIFQLCYDNGYRENSKIWIEHYIDFFNQLNADYNEAVAFHKEFPGKPLPWTFTDAFRDAAQYLEEMMWTPNTP
jgi:hypothetical protein